MSAPARRTLPPAPLELPPLDAWLMQTPFLSYTYSYPHKTAYRRFDPPRPLHEVWQHEDLSRLFLYLHLPFCEHRCGFCNLFTEANPAEGRPRQYLTQLRSEAEQVCDELHRLPQADRLGISELAVGGGTPTYLELDELEELLSIITDVVGADPTQIGGSIEASPATLSEEKLALLREAGFDRLSMGVQAFDSAALSGMGRPQTNASVNRALDLLAATRFPIINLDLIYGADGQSEAGWLASVDRVIDFGPEEVFLYPLYVRPQTGLGVKGERTGRPLSITGRTDSEWDALRLRRYRAGRDRLRDAGYEQHSLRMFRKAGVRSRSEVASEERGEYRCQRDAMIGLGCGARSYTESLHYSTEFATGRRGVQAILDAYLAREPASFSNAVHGFELDSEERRRRHLILSLFQVTGVDPIGYTDRFGDDVFTDFPALTDLLSAGLAEWSADHTRLRLTDSGVERSDLLGPWLFSERVRSRMADWDGE